MPQPIPQSNAPGILQEIVHAIESLRFGSVEITVHEGRITQIEKREKVRFSASLAKRTP